MKKRTSIMVEAETLRQCKIQDINMSEVCQRALESVLAGKHLKDEELYLAHLLTRRESYLGKLRLSEDRVSAVKQGLEVVDKRIQKQKDVVEVIHKSRIVASLMRELNHIIVLCEFDVEKAWVETEKLRNKLAEEEHVITKEFFVNHVEWLKTHL